jgi:ABC-type sulfate transport system substrate-binding protein
VLDSAARGSTNTFIQSGVGDVLINWENEILLSSAELAAANVEIVIPPMSILAEPVVAVVDRVVDRLGKYEDAVKHLERAVQLRPQDPVINDHLGDAYWRVGRQHEARFQWHRALSFKPEDKEKSKIEVKLDKGMGPAEPIGKAGSGG